jgi:hypothetical protein
MVTNPEQAPKTDKKNTFQNRGSINTSHQQNSAHQNLKNRFYKKTPSFLSMSI